MRALIDVPAEPGGPSVARQLTVTVLAGWGLTELCDDAALVVSELVTNAYQHAPGSERFELELVRRGRGIRIWLTDGSAVMPVVRELVRPECPGRGMRVVAALAAAWGVEPHHGGKCVWVDLG